MEKDKSPPQYAAGDFSLKILTGLKENAILEVSEADSTSNMSESNKEKRPELHEHTN